MENPLLLKFAGLINKYKVAIIVGLVGLIFILAGLIMSRANISKGRPVFSGSGSSKTIRVDVEGQIKHPGVYDFKEGDRADDAIKASGGFTDKVDRTWVGKNINLSDKLIDGQKIYIPAVGEVTTSSSSLNSNKVNLNTASETELDKLPGVGPVTVGKIVNARPFGSVEDLKIKKVVNSSTFEKIKDLVSVY